MLRLNHLLTFPREPTMAIHTGLSVTVAGHLLYLDRNEEQKTAVVRTKALNGVPTTMDVHAVKVAAELLQRRAQRFLGDWKVEIERIAVASPLAG
jgi:hypothetical protein